MAETRLPTLLEPEPRGRLSGGYLFNAALANHGAWELERTTESALPAALQRLRRGGHPVLLDSIFLRESTLGSGFDALVGSSPLGVMLHSFPSMIDAAEAGRVPPSAPTAWESAALGHVRFVLTPGDHYARMLAGTGIDVRIVAPGVDDEWRQPPRQRGAVCRLVAVGAVTPRKGFLDLVHALSARLRTDSELSIVGSLDAAPGYATEVREASQGLRVRLLGQQPPHVTRAEVLRSDVLVMPSYDENHPLVLLEAMAASVPAVAYDAGATSRMLIHGVHGLIGPIGDRVRLLEHLAQLIDDEPRRYRMAEACWTAQRQLPSWADTAQRARDVISAISD